MAAKKEAIKARQRKRAKGAKGASKRKPPMPKALSGLKAAPWNPRTIDKDAAAALAKSLGEFGDISGIVVHRDGYLIAGHQRIAALRRKYGPELPIVDGAVTTPDGGRWPVRVVDWPEAKARAANLAANNPLIGGKFTTAGAAAVDAVSLERPDLPDGLRLTELVYELPENDAEGSQGTGPEMAKVGPPAMELQPFEHYDYLLVLARNANDWAWLCDRLDIKRVEASPIPAKKKMGLGRAVDAARLIAALGGSACPDATIPVRTLGGPDGDGG